MIASASDGAGYHDEITFNGVAPTWEVSCCRFHRYMYSISGGVSCWNADAFTEGGSARCCDDRILMESAV